MDIIWIGFAFIIGALISRIHVPPLVGYLLAGLGLTLFGYEPDGLLHEISHLGVVFLLFTVGLHIRFKNMVQVEVLSAGITHMLISTAIFLPVSLYFGFDLQAAILISITLGFSSTVLAAKNLEMRNELGSYYGRVAIGILIIQDLVAIGLMAYSGGGVPSSWSLSLLALPLVRPVISKILALLDQDELVLLMALALAIGGASLFEWFNLSGELGALVTGMLLASDERADSLGKKLWGVKEAFLVGFFMEIGLIGLPNMADIYFIMVCLIILPLKSVLYFFLLTLFKLRARTAYLTAISLTAYSEFTLIAGAVAVSTEIIPAEALVALGLLTAISFALNAPLTIQEEKIWKKLEWFLLRWERDTKHPDHQPLTLGSSEFLILGMGNAGKTAYDELKKNNKKVVGMDIDPDRIQRNLNKGRRVLYGDIQNTEMWHKLDLSKVQAIIVAMGSPATKINAVQTIRENNYTQAIFVLTMRDDESQGIREAGGIPVPIPIKEVGFTMAELSMEYIKTNEVPSL
ncbi:MAG: cation:proton antiporter family protein [Balneolales bacterium]